MSLEASVGAVIRRSAESLGFEIIDLKIDGRRHVRVWIDREPGGVAIQDCVSVNRAANHALRDDGIDPGAFHIEVLSPGLDRPLTRPKDFERYAGKTVTVRLAQKRGDRRNWKGKLVGLREGRVVVHDETSRAEETFAIPDIEEARLVPEFPQKRH